MENSGSLDDGHAVFFQKGTDSAREAANDAASAGLKFGHIYLDLIWLDSLKCELCGSLNGLKHMRRLNERFRRNAADIETDAPQLFLFDQTDMLSILCGFNCSNISNGGKRKERAGPKAI